MRNRRSRIAEAFWSVAGGRNTPLPGMTAGPAPSAARRRMPASGPDRRRARAARALGPHPAGLPSEAGRPLFGAAAKGW
ncbi:hypothetical protein [Streptomyces sp. NRRL F-4474]|uniref:hypothetical protein n=1 Tax=Streptomyces sp. NRRL F-4474 TaxID=1463851 RepID=UPI00131B2422|nr:hypothetical protein [Streptomyces sp. NRRL F-4474]